MLYKLWGSFNCNYVDFADQIYIYFHQLRRAIFWTLNHSHATQICSSRHLCCLQIESKYYLQSSEWVQNKCQNIIIVYVLCHDKTFLWSVVRLFQSEHFGIPGSNIKNISFSQPYPLICGVIYVYIYIFLFFGYVCDCFSTPSNFIIF